ERRVPQLVSLRFRHDARLAHAMAHVGDFLFRSPQSGKARDLRLENETHFHELMRACCLADHRQPGIAACGPCTNERALPDMPPKLALGFEPLERLTQRAAADP